MNVGHATDAPLHAVPDRVALVVDGEALTYRQLEHRIRQVETALTAAGVRPGDRVALVNLGSALSVATIFGAARIGAATAQMNAYLTTGELGQLAELTGTRIGVAGDRYAESLRSVLDGPVLVEEEVFGAEVDEDAESASVGRGEDTALVLFTSGTTGLPKPIPISHEVVADRLAFYAKPIDPEVPQVVDMMSAPIFHIAGTLGLFVSLRQGKQMVLLPKFDPAQWLALVERHRVTQTFVVPTMLRRILDHPEFDTTDLSSLRSLSYGAAAAPVDLVRRAVATFPAVDFSNTFGQTETLGAYAALTPEDHRRGDRFDSVGRPLAGVDLRIVEPGTDREVEPGTVGEFVVRADQNTTTEWLHTGDTGRQDAEGYLYLVGRLSDTINRGGEKFGPIEVEEVLRSHPSVVDAGAVGVPDPDLGERVGAIVVVSEPVSVEALLRHCASELATYKVPEYLEIADELPVTVLGKPDRLALRARLGGAERVGRIPS
jgi:acyl-CoA synthetase (AMP-forming)/AMP-acid ligase II